MMKKILIATSGVILLLALLAVTTVTYLYYSTTNEKNSTLHLEGLSGPVTINIDRHGIPHIYSPKSDNDVFFALGFIHARDRLWQMEFQRRIAQGALSEVFGKTTLEQDKFLRTLGFYRSATQAWPAFDAKTKAILISYTAGVNAFIDSGKLPLQFKLLRYKPKPWTVIDSLAWQKLMSWNLQSSWRKKIDNYLIAQKLGSTAIPIIFPQYPNSGPTILSTADLRQSRIASHSKISNYLPVLNANSINTLKKIVMLEQQIRNDLGFQYAPGKGSNNWVISGRFTENGKPILANDPHLALSAPPLWYLAELKGPHLHAVGATIPGTPGVIIGHNDHIAWGVTNVNPDAQDLYVEDDSTPMQLIHENIKIRHKRSINFVVHISPHGPIINDAFSLEQIAAPVALKWTALQPNDTTVESFIKIDYASNWQDFTNALRYYISPSQNFIYADTAGNIGYYMSGKIPIRTGWSGLFPLFPGHQMEWSGYIPFAEMPHVYNPPEGMIASANNKATPDNYLYPLVFRWESPPYRAERILQLLHLHKKLSMADNIAIQKDVNSLLWKDLRKELLTTKPLNKQGRIAIKLLSFWSGNMSLDSTPASIFAVWYAFIDKNLKAQIPVNLIEYNPLFVKQQLLTNGNYCKSGNIKSCSQLLSASLEETTNFLQHKFGTNPLNWKWRYLHHTEFKELGMGESKLLGWIWNRKIATPGGNDTPDVGSYAEDTFIQTHGASYRQIINLDNLSSSLFMQTMGQSENPFSHNYENLMKMWRGGRYVEINAKSARWGKCTTIKLLPSPLP